MGKTKDIRDAVDAMTGPVMYTSLSIILFAVMLYFRKFFTSPNVAFAILNLTLLCGGWSMTTCRCQPTSVPSWSARQRSIRTSAWSARGR